MEDSDPALRELLLSFLEQHGHTASRTAAPQHARTPPADVLLIDLTPTRHGDPRACRVMHPRAELSALILMAVESEAGAASSSGPHAQAHGAESPSTSALFARVLALRRSYGAMPASRDAPIPATARFAGWTLDLATRRLADADGTTVAVPHTEFALLLAFLDHPHQVLTREQLAGRTRGPECYATVRTLDVYVSRLRRRLRSGVDGPNIIGTRRNLGYVLDADAVFE